MSKCRGCGITLQSENKNLIGFIPKEKQKEKLCVRCFKIIHYNMNKEVDIINNEDILKEVNKKNYFVFFLIDFLNINNETINTFKKIKNNKCLVISKLDYLPKYFKLDKIKKWLKNTYNIENVLFISSKYKRNINSLFKEEKTFYLMGYTNAGKSTLINSLTNNNITTSYYNNTTLNFLKIQYENYTIIDTPGFQYNYSFNNLNKLLNIKNIIKPITYQLKNNTSIIIEDIVRIDNESDKTNLTIYLSNLLNIKKVYEKNNELKTLDNIDLDIKKDYDLVIKNIGFITFKTNSKIKIYVKNKDLIEIRESVFGEYYE